MAQTALITLTSAGDDTGPFNLYSNLDGYTVPFESNIPKGDLLVGYLSNQIPDGASTVRVKSNNVLCDNYIDLVVPTTTTTTTVPPTTTTTTTEAPSTTTTTTTAVPKAIFRLNNNTASDVSINTINLSGGAALVLTTGSLPVEPGQHVIGEITPVGTYNISLSGISIINSHVTTRGSDLVQTCIDHDFDEEGNSLNMVFLSVQCNDTQAGSTPDVLINVDTGLCHEV